MEEQPSWEASEVEARMVQRRRFVDFWRRVFGVLVAASVGSVLFALMVGPRSIVGFSNGLFIAGAILLLVGLLPLVADIFGRAAVSFDKEDRSVKEVLQEQRERSKRTEPITYLFSVSGVIAIILSLFLSSLVLS